jgi:hypothetical protein
MRPDLDSVTVKPKEIIEFVKKTKKYGRIKKSILLIILSTRSS